MRASLMTVFALVGCVEDRALLSVPVYTTPSQTEFEVDDGVSIALTTASLTVADLRLEGHTHTHTTRRRSWSLLSTAYAHPGHDHDSSVAGELMGSWTLDLLGAETLLGQATGYEGEYATARLSLLPTPETIFEGTATVDGQPQAFSFVLALDQEVTGLDFAEALDGASTPDRITLFVDLAHTLSFVDWRTPDDDNDALLTTKDGQVGNVLPFGIASTPTYRLSVEK